MLVAKRFSQVADHYCQKASVQTIIGTSLLSRLDYHRITPRVILDLGAGPGHFSLSLQKRYPKARIISLDISHEMLRQGGRRFRKSPSKLQATMCALPIKTNSIDMIFANQSIHWGEDVSVVFKEIARVLKEEGLVLFSSLGPDTFKEIKTAWASVDTYQHVNPFLDMHDIGDRLLAAGLRDPVVDMDMMTARYRTVKALSQDLKSQGVNNTHSMRHKGLMSRRRWQQFEINYEKCRDSDGLLPLSYEVVYGQAWGKLIKKKADEICVPITEIKTKRLA